MLKKDNLLFGTLLAVFVIIIFVTILRDNRPSCQLALSELVFIPKGESYVISDFSPSEWQTSNSNPEVSQIRGDEIFGLQKGQSQLTFEKESNPDCSFEVTIEVANVATKTGQKETGAMIDLPKNDGSGKINSLLPPAE